MDIDNYLEQWSLWSKTNNSSNLGYPNTTNFSQLSKPSIDEKQRIKPFILITDDEALKIDRAISRLDKDLSVAVKEKYLFRRPNTKICKIMKISRNEVSAKLMTARRVIAHLLMVD